MTLALFVQGNPHYCGNLKYIPFVGCEKPRFNHVFYYLKTTFNGLADGDRKPHRRLNESLWRKENQGE